MEDAVGSNNREVPRWGATAPQRIMVGVPTHSGRVDYRLAKWLAEIANAKAAKISFKPYTSPVEFARNCLVKSFLESDCEKLWMIDDDLAPPDAAWAMASTPGDIVSGLYLVPFRHPDTGQWRVMPTAYKETGGVLHSLEMPQQAGPYPVDAAGTGCLIISRKVLEDTRMRFVNTDNPTDPVPAVFQYQRAPNGRDIMGEDIDFTRRATKLGYSVVLDTRFMYDHRKECSLKDTMDMAISYAAAI